MGSTYGFCTKHPTCTLSGVSCAVCEALAQLADLRAKLHAAEEVIDAEADRRRAAEEEWDEHAQQIDDLNRILRDREQDGNRWCQTARRYREALEQIAAARYKGAHWYAREARKALDNECPAGGPHTISPNDTECVECGARRPERGEAG